MYHTTGFTQSHIAVLYAALNNAYPVERQSTGRPPALTRVKEIQVALIYVRRNRTEDELAESFGTSQSTISRVIARWIPRMVEALRECVPTVDDLDPTESLIVDGTLVPCWDWAQEEGLYSGKHHLAGLNLQVACDLSGRLAWVSDPTRGATHDAKAIDASGILEHFPDGALMGDKGYIGKGMITPDRKPTGREYSEEQKNYNRSVNSIRSMVALRT